MNASSTYLDDLAKRATDAARILDEVYAATHPFGTVEAELIREMARVIQGMAR